MIFKLLWGCFMSLYFGFVAYAIVEAWRGRKWMLDDDEDVPSEAALQAIVRKIKDGLPLTTSEEDLRVAIAKGSWEMALKWSKRSTTLL